MRFQGVNVAEEREQLGDVKVEIDIFFRNHSTPPFRLNSISGLDRTFGE